jgi:hypothetical protein
VQYGKEKLSGVFSRMGKPLEPDTHITGCSDLKKRYDSFSDGFSFLVSPSGIREMKNFSK